MVGDKKKFVYQSTIAIKGYRAITGACELGVKEFVKSQGELPTFISVEELLERTKGHFGHEELKKFVGDE